MGGFGIKLDTTLKANNPFSFENELSRNVSVAQSNPKSISQAQIPSLNTASHKPLFLQDNSKVVGAFALGIFATLAVTYLAKHRFNFASIVKEIKALKSYAYKIPMNGNDVHLKNYLHLPVKPDYKILPVFTKPEPQILKTLEEKFEVIPMWNYSNMAEVPGDVLTKAQEAKHVLTHFLTLWSAKLDEKILGQSRCVLDEMLETMPNLKYICNSTTGARHNVASMLERGIITTQVRDVQSKEIGLFSLGHVIKFFRNFNKTHLDILERGSFDYTNIVATGAQDIKVGVVGFGSIGSEIGHVFAKAGVKSVSYFATADKRNGYKFCPTVLNLFEESNVIVNILPESEKTVGIINKVHLNHWAKVKPGQKCVIVNVGRPGQVVEGHTLEWLRGDPVNRFAHFDVADGEPNISQAMLDYAKKYGNLTFSDHIAAGTLPVRTRLWEGGVSNVLSISAGKGPLTVLNDAPRLKWWADNRVVKYLVKA